MFAITFALFVFFIIILCINIKQRRNNKNVKAFLTPPSTLPILGNTLDFYSSSDIIHLLQDYSKYGKLVKICVGLRTRLLVSDCRLVAYVLSSNKTIRKGSEYATLVPWLGQGLVTAKGDAAWKTHRKMIARCFHNDVYKNFINVYKRNANILVSKWKKHLDVPSFDIWQSIALASLDIICESALGTFVGSQERSDSDIVTNIRFMCDLIIDRAFNVLLQSNVLYRLTKRYQKEQVVVKSLHDYAKEIIERRKKLLRKPILKGIDNDNNQLTLLDLLLKENENGKVFTNSALQDEVQTFIFAGHDTVSSALNFTIYCLSENLEVQDKVVEEFTKILENNPNNDITVKNLSDMRYLEAVIKESLRLYPPVPFYTRTGHDFKFDGYFITKDMSITFNVFGIHRDKELYPEPERFIPERFFNQSDVPYSYIPFSAGPRSCIGQKFAMFELKYVLVTLLKHFVILPTSPKHKVDLSGAGILHSKNGIRITLKERNQ